MKLHWPNLAQLLHLKKSAAKLDKLSPSKSNPTSTRTASTRAALLGTPLFDDTSRGDNGDTLDARDMLHDITGAAANPGNLRFYEFIPAGLKRKAPLVVLLHGCQQNAKAYLEGSGWAQLARENGFAILLGEQRSSNNPTRCFNWFQPVDTSAGGGEAHSIQAMTLHLLETYKLNPARVFISGLSAGAAMSAAMLASHPQTFKAGAVIAGLPYGAATNMGQAFSAMLAPTNRSAADWGDLVRRTSPGQTSWPHLTIWHGANDRTVSPANASALEKQWCNLHALEAGAVEDITLPGLTHRKWHDSVGALAVESITITGMDHGVAIDTAGKNGPALGKTGPYFLDVGLSSTHHIAKSWELL